MVQAALDNLMKNRTVLVIAHRLSTVKAADTIVVLEGGKVLEKGNHQQLVKRQVWLKGRGGLIYYYFCYYFDLF